MTDANELYEAITPELNNVVSFDTGQTEEEQESFNFHEETVSDDIPPSLLSYFETSKSRAAVCEKFFLEELEDFTASHLTKDMMNFPIELDKDTMKLDMQDTCGTENEEHNSSTDTDLPPAPRETEALYTHNVSVCPYNEDEAEMDEYMGCQKYLEFKVRTLKSSMKEEEIKQSSEYQREHREEQHCEEMKKVDQRRQRERDFQEELKKIMEAEKLHQKELELMEKRAQEKLEQELLLQQELISNLRKRVEEERKMREEEQERIKEEGERKRKEEEERRKREEEDRRKREVERIKREMERKKMEEETRRNKEEEEKRKIEEMRLKEEHRKKKEEEQKKMEEEEKRRIEKEEKRKREEEEKNKVEEYMRKKEEERKSNEIRLKEEEKRRQVEEEERKRKENEKIKEREKKRIREVEEETREREEEKKMIEVARKKMEEDKRRKNEEEIRLKEEGRNSDDKYKRREEEEEKRKSDEETRKKEVEKKTMVEQMKRKEEENRQIEEMQLKENGEKRENDMEEKHSMECKDMIRMEEEKNTKEEEWKKWQEEEMRQQKKEEYSNIEEELRLKKEKELNEAHEADNRKMEDERKTKDKEKRQEEEDYMRKREDGRGNIEADKRQINEDVRKKKKEKIKAEEKRLEEEESNKIRVRDAEKEERLMRANELQERKRENDSMKTQNESKNRENTRNPQTSQLENGNTLTPSSPGPLHSESTASPTSSETIQQLDLNKDISQTSVYKTMNQQDAALEPCFSSGSLPVCLPEHTEQKRLSWMKDCVPWSKLSLQNRRKQKGCVRSQRGLRRAAEASSLPPLCPHTLLQSTGCKSLQEVTTVTLGDLPGCSLSPLAQCTHLQSLTLRRCGLKSLEGINQLPQLCYVDVQENDISFVDCENMSSLRVLRLGHNKLTSIHGLSGAENLDVLDLSHNSITRIAGLESMRRLHWLSVDHNQLISSKGLRDVYTLLHLDCSHNHLASVEGLENMALLQTLDLRANSLTEPPSLNNHILLRELHLDDNSISSLQGLVVCWLPLICHFSVAQNRITLLPSMSDFVSLANLDLSFNCLSELQNVCESLEGCQFLREVHLTGNPLQQESGWRSTLQRAVAGLRAIDGQDTDSSLSAPAVQQVSSDSGSFLTFCQAQLKQTQDLQQRHSRELSNASSHLDAVKSSCRHFTETLKLAVDQRYAHEYGSTTVSAAQTTAEKTLDMGSTNAQKPAEHLEMESTEEVPPSFPSRNNVNCSYWTLEEKSSTESWRDTLHTVTTALKSSPHSLGTKGKLTARSHFEMAPLSNHQDRDPKNTAAVMIQQRWRKYRLKCGNISSPPTAERGGGRGVEGAKPESGPPYINRSVVGQDYAATIIQAFWKGFTLRRRLASALAAVTCPDSGEDEIFEEVDVDEFVFDEAALEKHWTLLLTEDSPSRHHPVSEQSPSLEPTWPFPEPSQYALPPPPLWRAKQAWVVGEQVDSSGQRISPESSDRSKSPASTSVLSGLSARSKKILEEWGFKHSHTALLMLKRAQRMKLNKQQKKKHGDPPVRPALFRNCNYQRDPVEARNRPAPHSRNYMKVCEAELGLHQAEETEQVKREQAQQWLHTQSDRDPESEHFLPEINSDILNGGRVQLVADPGYTECLHHASGLWANSSLAAQPSKERNYPRRNSLGLARKELPAPKQVTSAPLKRERISFRDNPVQLSGGWGGGKKRDKVYK
ncbi:leucine-rich repeat and IQ domain-containing protein 1 [Xiphias gladius]|uniref:leucine-rich repeat and IQ domain-containing protein 1 n=1 Tax=Xiphias gladius TaxID=8245 RepID=UPI001A98CBD9|nr:leucine-rich repeat and IQ domain-containing protein 1 [Xiphias gladius]